MNAPHLYKWHACAWMHAGSSSSGCTCAVRSLCPSLPTRWHKPSPVTAVTCHMQHTPSPLAQLHCNMAEWPMWRIHTLYKQCKHVNSWLSDASHEQQPPLTPPNPWHVPRTGHKTLTPALRLPVPVWPDISGVVSSPPRCAFCSDGASWSLAPASSPAVVPWFSCRCELVALSRVDSAERPCMCSN